MSELAVLRRNGTGFALGLSRFTGRSADDSPCIARPRLRCAIRAATDARTVCASASITDWTWDRWDLALRAFDTPLSLLVRPPDKRYGLTGMEPGKQVDAIALTRLLAHLVVPVQHLSYVCALGADRY